MSSDVLKLQSLSLRNFPKVKAYDVYQTIAGKPTFVKEVVYQDLKAFNSMWQETNDSKVQKVMGEFFSYVLNLEGKLIMEIG